jgi:hypothetical protein
MLQTKNDSPVNSISDQSLAASQKHPYISCYGLTSVSIVSVHTKDDGAPILRNYSVV